MPGRSIVSNLMELSIRVTNALKEGKQIDAIYLDLSKAFDSVDHRLLLSKLIKFGIKGSFLNFFHSYLTNRYQIVLVNGNTSKPYKVTSGVIQGSRLGPLLFSIFINEFPTVVKFSHLELFADDCRLSMKICGPDDVIKLQGDIDNITLWIKNNKLNINGAKSRKITFARTNDIISSNYIINGSVVLETEKVRDLGVLLDSKWSFNDQINAVLSKSLRTLGFIKRVSTYFSSIKTIIYLFKILVLPTISFAAVIWSPYTSEKFEMLNGIVKKF